MHTLALESGSSLPSGQHHHERGDRSAFAAAQPGLEMLAGTWFIVSDDYIPLFAALTGLPDYVPCRVLGKPDSTLLRNVQGPIDPEEVPKLPGVA